MNVYGLEKHVQKDQRTGHAHTLSSRKYPDTFEFGCELSAREILFANFKINFIENPVINHL